MKCRLKQQYQQDYQETFRELRACIRYSRCHQRRSELYIIVEPHGIFRCEEREGENHKQKLIHLFVEALVNSKLVEVEANIRKRQRGADSSSPSWTIQSVEPTDLAKARESWTSTYVFFLPLFCLLISYFLFPDISAVDNKRSSRRQDGLLGLGELEQLHIHLRGCRQREPTPRALRPLGRSRDCPIHL